MAEQGKNGITWTDATCMLDPLKWKEPRRIFVNSMSDMFHENLPDEAIDRIFGVMALCPQHTFHVLTKRPERMLDYVTKNVRENPNHTGAGLRYALITVHQQWGKPTGALPSGFRWPLPNVWLGVSVEDQAAADERIPLLLKTPAWVHWISAEPLLGNIVLRKEWIDIPEIEVKVDADLYDALGVEGRDKYARSLRSQASAAGLNKLDWVVVGGESGPGARPMHPDWARSLRDQCVAAGVAFHFKQHGEWIDGVNMNQCDAASFRGCQWHDWGTLPMSYRVGKHAAGRTLDGRTWDEYPEVRA